MKCIGETEFVNGIAAMSLVCMVLLVFAQEYFLQQALGWARVLKRFWRLIFRQVLTAVVFEAPFPLI